MLISEINKCIKFENFKIPASAGQVEFNYGLFEKLRSLGTSAAIYDFLYDIDENNGDGLPEISWIEVYEKGNYNMKNHEVWDMLESIFKAHGTNPALEILASRYDDKINNTINIYLITEQDGFFWIYYTIYVKRRQVNLKKYFPQSYFINKYPKNRIPLKYIINRKRNY